MAGEAKEGEKMSGELERAIEKGAEKVTREWRKKKEREVLGLGEIRSDLWEIILVKKTIDYQNCYNNSKGASERFFGGTGKKEAIERGIKIIKCIIIDLAEKYMKDSALMEWKKGPWKEEEVEV